MKDVRKLVIAAVKCYINRDEENLNRYQAIAQTDSVIEEIAKIKKRLPKFKGLLHELQTKNAVILTTGYIWTDD